MIVAPASGGPAVPRPLAPVRWWIDGLIVASACALFLALTLYQLRLPGLYYDEAWDAVSTMQIVHGLPVELERGAHIMLFGRAWPLMLDDYQGIISTYLLIPFFLIAGPGVFAIRAFPILSGVIALVLCYFLARAWFGRPAAWVAILLFAVAPSWVFWSRLGVYVVAEVVPLTLGALLAFTVWWRAPRGRNGALYLGSSLMGLGLATKLLYIWPIVAVLACYALLHGRTLWQARARGLRALRPAWIATPHPAIVLTLLGAILCFAAGAFTFLAYNWQTGGTILKIRSSFVQTEYGANNTTVLPNLWEEMDRFRVVLDGGYFWFQTQNALPYTDPAAPAAFVLAAVGLLALAIRALPPASPGARGPWRGRGLLAAAYAPALGLLLVAYALPNSRSPAVLIPALGAILLAAGAGAALVALALRRAATWARPAGALLLASTLASGCTWLLTGAPDGQARGPLDLRLADAGGLLFWISLAELLLLLGWSRPATPWQRPLVATLGFLAAVLAQSFPTLSGLWPTHLVVMLPLPQILVGAAVGVGARGWPVGNGAAMPAGPRRRAPAAGRGRRLRAGGAALGVLVLAASSLWTDLRYHGDLAQSGGLYAFSDGIYSLAAYLAKAPDQPIVAAEWGIRRPLQILSEGRMMPEEIFQYGPAADPAILAAFDAALAQTLKDPAARYVFTAGTIGPYNRFGEFARVLAARGLVPLLEHRSYMRDGRSIYEVYTARAPAR